MIFEIAELDNASQGTRWAEGIGDPLHVVSVVVTCGACKEHKCAELNGDQPAAAQLPDREVRALQNLVQPCGDARLPRDGGGHALDVLEHGTAGRSPLALVSGLDDRTRSAFSHPVRQP